MTEEGFLGLTRSKPWLSMEWNDGSKYVPPCPAIRADPVDSPSEIDASDLSLPPPAEPFLLASDVDLEEELSLSDATGTTYLRPFSRVYMAEKYQIYGVPQLMVYHLGERRVLTKHARFSTIKGDYGEDTLARWEKGESTDFGFSGQSPPLAGETLMRQMWSMRCDGRWAGRCSRCRTSSQSGTGAPRTSLRT